MRFIKGNILDSEAQALVNTVNTVGVMGKGIALQFKEQFPQNYKAYQKACKAGQVKIGSMFVFRETNLDGEKIIINFPTKQEWYRKSQYSYIEEGLNDLARVIRGQGIQSIAIPPLGCGHGGLNWEKVKALITKYLGDLQGVEIIIFEPNTDFKEILQNKQPDKEIKLTPARAMLLYAMFRYEKYGEYATVFTANKLAYFLQLSGEPLKLKFESYLYGPYSLQVEKVLYALNGKYLKGMEQLNYKPFEPLVLNYDLLPEIIDFIDRNLNYEQKDRLKRLFEIIQGFESALSLEVLASVDFLVRKEPGVNNDELAEKISAWNTHKKNLIKKEHVSLAYQHLKEYGSRLEFA